MKINENQWKSVKISEINENHCNRLSRVHHWPTRHCLSVGPSISSRRKLMKINENQWKFMKIHENSWKSVKINENQWKSSQSTFKGTSLTYSALFISWSTHQLIQQLKKINENQWKSMKIHENQWKSVKINENHCNRLSREHHWPTRHCLVHLLHENWYFYT